MKIRFKMLCLTLLVSGSLYGKDFVSVSYYEAFDGAGPKMRIETFYRSENCKNTQKAQLIYKDETNELREVALFNPKDGKIMHVAPDEAKTIISSLRENALSKDPCSKDAPVNPASSGKSASPQ